MPDHDANRRRQRGRTGGGGRDRRTAEEESEVKGRPRDRSPSRALEGRRPAEDPQQVKICGPRILNLPNQVANCWIMSIFSLGKWFLDLTKV